MNFQTAVVALFVLFSDPAFAQQTTDSSFSSEGKASYYARQFQGRKTASGDRFSNYDYTAAHRTLPFGTYLNVVNKKNNFNVVVRVNDRGPFVKNRIIDLSEAASRRIGGYHSGVIPVKVQVLNLLTPGPLIDSIFTAAPVVDCFGKVAEPEGFMLSLWSTNDLVHAIYVANDLYLKEDVNHVYIANQKVSDKLLYHVVIGDVEDKKKALELKNHYEHKGFMKVTFYDR